MDPKSFDLAALPKPIQEMLAKLDPIALKSLLMSLDGEDIQSMLTGAKGYINNMPDSEREAFQKFIASLTQGTPD